MTAQEYAALRSRAGYRDDAGPAWGGERTPYVPFALCVGFALWLIPIIAINQMSLSGELATSIGLWSLVVLWIASFWFFRRRARRLDLVLEAKAQASDAVKRTRYAADLEARELDELRLRVVDAVEGEGDEDVGHDFYLLLEDGRVLLVSENDLGDEAIDEDYNLLFPTREVLVTWLPHADEMFHIVGSGEILTVSESWPSFTMDVLEDDRRPYGKFLPGPISRYRNLHYE